MMELFEALQDSKEQELLTLFEKAVDLSAFHLRSMFRSGRAKIIHDNLLPVVIEKSLQFHLGDQHYDSSAIVAELLLLAAIISFCESRKPKPAVVEDPDQESSTDKSVTAAPAVPAARVVSCDSYLA